MKKEALPVLASIILTGFLSFISAQFYSRGISFSRVLDSFDPRTIFFFVVFGLLLVALHGLVFMKLFRDNRTFSLIFSLLMSFGISYGLYRWDFIGAGSVDSFFFSIGLGGDALWPILVFAFTALVLIMFWKFRSRTFFILGAAFLLLSFTDLFYEKVLARVIGSVLILIGLAFLFKERSGGGFSMPKIEAGFDGLLVLLGLIGVLIGILTGSMLYIIAGVILVLVGLFFWRRTKNKARGLGQGTAKGIGKTGKWVGNKSKDIAQDQWGKEKEAMRERKRKAKKFAKEQMRKEKEAMRKRKEKSQKFAQDQWRKEKEAMRKRKELAKRGGKWFGRKSKDVAKDQWRKEQEAMRKRKEKLNAYRERKKMEKAKKEALEENKRQEERIKDKEKAREMALKEEEERKKREAHEEALKENKKREKETKKKEKAKENALKEEVKRKKKEAKKIEEARKEALKEERGRMLKRLTIEAQAYRQEADRQQNPAMYRNWAHFIGYLKRRGYGKNEREILKRLNLRKKDMRKVVKKYIL